MQIDGPSLQGTECFVVSVTSVTLMAIAGANPALRDIADTTAKEQQNHLMV